MPYPHISHKIFTAKAATGASEVVAPARNGNFDYQFSKTGTGTGDLAFQTNDLTDVEFKTDPTAGWIQHDMAAGTGVTSGKVDVPATNPWTQKVKLTNVSARRCRWVLTIAAGSMSVDGWVAGN
jgi:hypothetical protein